MATVCYSYLSDGVGENTLERKGDHGHDDHGFQHFGVFGVDNKYCVAVQYKRFENTIGPESTELRQRLNANALS